MDEEVKCCVDAINFCSLSHCLMKFLQKSGCWKTPVFFGGVITKSKLGIQSVIAFWRHHNLLGFSRVEGIAAILQEFRLNESTFRGIAAQLHHFRPF
ncbi:hypothetical protein [Paenibacillus dendritiformis]|uniref:hypothetical protein n=1 Tax=Paenibacillus dendritiformis TaxID=130049 RepID=UPI0020C1F37A|nr:hypothetical protein [Paenibacillus dendritiformis]CAH8767751.1 hypothetical protein H7S4_000421 [Paenibacillus dendritiformis]